MTHYKNLIEDQRPADLHDRFETPDPVTVFRDRYPDPTWSTDELYAAYVQANNTYLRRSATAGDTDDIPMSRSRADLQSKKARRLLRNRGVRVVHRINIPDEADDTAAITIDHARFPIAPAVDDT